MNCIVVCVARKAGGTTETSGQCCRVLCSCCVGIVRASMAGGAEVLLDAGRKDDCVFENMPVGKCGGLSFQVLSRRLLLVLLMIGGVERNPGPPKNVKVLKKGVSKEDQAVILDAHNRLRHRVAKGQETRGRPGPQPPAADMRKLFYDKELAAKAQKWTNECIFEHDPDEKRQVARFKVGQNLYQSQTTDHTDDGRPDWNQAIQAWYDEVEIFNKAIVNKFRSTRGIKIGHYTQMVWADSYLVGAGYIFYKELNSKWYTKLYTCNYGPTGNYVDRPIYIVGQPCSKAPAGTKKDTKYNGLCTIDRQRSCQIL